MKPNRKPQVLKWIKIPSELHQSIKIRAKEENQLFHPFAARLLREGLERQLASDNEDVQVEALP